jgi:hypothetical protein
MWELKGGLSVCRLGTNLKTREKCNDYRERVKQTLKR